MTEALTLVASQLPLSALAITSRGEVAPDASLTLFHFLSLWDFGPSGLCFFGRSLLSANIFFHILYFPVVFGGRAGAQ